MTIKFHSSPVFARSVFYSVSAVIWIISICVVVRAVQKFIAKKEKLPFKIGEWTEMMFRTSHTGSRLEVEEQFNYVFEKVFVQN